MTDDQASLKDLQWQRGGYRIDDLDRIFTGNDRRAALVIEKVRSILLDPMRCRALGFCVSVAHAAYMAEKFKRARYPGREPVGRHAGHVRRGGTAIGSATA